MSSWISVSEDSDFSLRNLPYGIFSTAGTSHRVGTAIGDYVLDLKALVQDHVLDDLGFDTTTLEANTLNSYAGLGKTVHLKVRDQLQRLLEKDTTLGNVLRDHEARRAKCLIPLDKVQMHLPMHVGDYTDFFLGLYHAENCAGILKPGAVLKETCPAFYDIPVAYHGRSSSIVVSGTPFRRPRGHYRVNTGQVVNGICQKLDYEAEFAFFVGQGNEMGSSIDADDAEDHIFGAVLMNDWSARDLQLFEAPPNGPFQGKNFCTSVSPWIVPLEALDSFRTAPTQPRPLAPYMTQKEAKSCYDIPVQVSLEADSKQYHVATCNTNSLTYSFAQMLAQHTRNGCPLRPGDLIATGTISGPTREEYGCFLETSKNGVETYEMEARDGSKLDRMFLEDNDIIEFRAHVKAPDGLGNVGFGVCSGQVLPALPI